MTSHKRMRYCLIPLLFVCLLIGCGKSATQITQPVSGIVTLDGTPLEGANITFHPKTSGDVAGGFSTSGGQYTVQTMQGEPGKGTTPGEYLVTAVKMESVPTGKKIENSDGTTIDEATERSVVPKIYSSRETTPVAVTVVKGKNTINIELSSSAK